MEEEYLRNLQKKIMSFLQDENGISRIEYAVLIVLIFLGIVVVLKTILAKGIKF
jgi:Flp pilus assembly pilin Flp